VRQGGVEVVSSAELVQTAKTRWGKAGRTSHYVAAHHLAAIKDDAFSFIGGELEAGRTVTEWDVSRRIAKAYETRGLVSDVAPIVAAGPNSADPSYVPQKTGSRAIQAGDIVVIDLWARQDGDPLAIYADIAWTAYAGDKVPKKYAEPFALVVKARDDTVAFVAERVKAHKPVRGYEADNVARGELEKAGWGDRYLQRTGHSIDTSHHGDGANLDDYETHDVRTLIQGTGFAVAPGLYQAGDFGVRSEVDCFLGENGLEVTTPAQKEIVPLLP
jgi:Xaa-Pro aminopeptidase